MLRTPGLLCIVFLLLICTAACSNQDVVSYETVQSFQSAQGSMAMGYSAASLNKATRLSEVRSKCGTPIAEWEDRVAFFNPKLKRLKYRTYDVHQNVMTAVFTFASTSSDPSLISIDYDPSSSN